MTTIYIDENFAPQLAKSLNLIQSHLNLKEKIKFQVISIGERFERGAKDEDWIPMAGNENTVVITQDLRIQTTREIYIINLVLVFFLFQPPLKKDFHSGKWFYNLLKDGLRLKS